MSCLILASCLQFYTVIKNVKKVHQLQESGEFQEFNDDVEYILDALQQSNPIGNSSCLIYFNPDNQINTYTYPCVKPLEIWCWWYVLFMWRYVYILKTHTSACWLNIWARKMLSSNWYFYPYYLLFHRYPMFISYYISVKMYGTSIPHAFEGTWHSGAIFQGTARCS